MCIGVCYRSPNIDDDENKCLMDTIRFFSSDLVVIMGDFNHRDVDWKRWQSDSSKGQEFLEIMSELFLTQDVNQETRGSNILDLVFSSESGLVEDLEICSPVSNSDHNGLLFKIGIDLKTEIVTKEIFNYNQADFESINYALRGIDWDEKFISKNLNNMWSSLVDELVEYVNKIHFILLRS